MSDVMTTVVVTQAVAANLREFGRRIGINKRKHGLQGMFTAKLSASGNLPATHYISSGLIDPDYLWVMTNPTRLFNAAKKAWNDDGDVFPFTQAQVTNALSNCTVSNGRITKPITPPGGGAAVDTEMNEGPHELIARLGLKIISEPV